MATARPLEPRYVARGVPGVAATWWYVLDRETGLRAPVGHGEGCGRIAQRRAAARNLELAERKRGIRRLDQG